MKAENPMLNKTQTQGSLIIDLFKNVIWMVFFLRPYIKLKEN